MPICDHVPPLAYTAFWLHFTLRIESDSIPGHAELFHNGACLLLQSCFSPFHIFIPTFSVVLNYFQCRVSSWTVPEYKCLDAHILPFFTLVLVSHDCSQTSVRSELAAGPGKQSSITIGYWLDLIKVGKKKVLKVRIWRNTHAVNIIAWKRIDYIFMAEQYDTMSKESNSLGVREEGNNSGWNQPCKTLLWNGGSEQRWENGLSRKGNSTN